MAESPNVERHNVGSRQISVHLNALLQARAIYKKRLDDVAMLEKHITQARARDIAETEHATKQGRLHVVEAPVKLPPGRCEVCVCVCLSVSLRLHSCWYCTISMPLSFSEHRESKLRT